MDDRLAEIYHTPISELHNLPMNQQALYRLRNLGNTQDGGWLNYKLREIIRRNHTDDALLKIQETAARNIALSLENLMGAVDWGIADEMFAGWEEDQLMERHGQTSTTP